MSTINVTMTLLKWNHDLCDNAFVHTCFNDCFFPDLLLAEVCHPSSCISAGKCDSPSETRTSCLLDGEVCCSVGQ